MKPHCRSHKTLFSLLTFCTFASFNGCDTHTNVVQTPPATPETNAAAQLQAETNEQALQNIKQAEEKKKLEDEEIQALSLKYNEFTIKEIQETVYLYKTGHMSYTQAKTDIEAIIQTASHWAYSEPDNSFPKGMCYIVAKRAIASSGEIYDNPPLISLSRDESLGPIMLFSKRESISANGTPTIQIQLGVQTPENVNYEVLEGRPLLILTENQYNDILNSDHDIKVLITKDTNTVSVNIASGNIKECADKFEHINLNIWEYREKTDAFDDVTYRFCYSASPNKVLAKLNYDPNGGRTESPVLLIRQIDNKLPEIILNSSGILWSPNLEHKIRLRFDDEKPISTSFVNGSGTVTQIFLNSEKKLLQKLFSSKQVIFQMPSNRETFSFDLTELPEKCAGLDLSAIKK